MVSTLNSISMSSLFSEDESKKTCGINIKLKASEIADEFISCGDYSSLTSKSIDTLDEYKIARSLQLTSQKQDSNLITKNVDYEIEFKDLLSSRGCSNEKELQALNRTSYKTVDQLRSSVGSTIKSIITDALSDDSDLQKYVDLSDDIVSDLSVEELADFVNSPEESIKKIMKLLQNLIEKYKDNPEMKNKLSGIKELLEKLEKAQEKLDNNKNPQSEENQKKYIKKIIDQYEK